jgi:hypothetical protein
MCVGGVFRFEHPVLYYIPKHRFDEGRLSVDWKRIKAEYIAGGTSYRKLCEKYGCTLAELRAVAKKERWVELKAQAQHKADTKLVESISDREVQKAINIIDVADKLLGKIIEVLEGVTTTQDIRHLTSALKDLRDIKGVKSEADMREQEARIAKLQRDAQEETEDKSITVVFGSDAEDFSE